MDAELIVGQGHRAFGRRIPITDPIHWNALGNNDKSWPSNPYWWQIDIRSDERLGDVKWTWELGRHRDIVVLARAALLRPEDEWIDELNKRLRWWFATTPAERGVHWYSNLEIALRTIAWMQVYALCSRTLEDDVLKSMALHVAQSRRHLLVDFPYTASSMRNNHLLGDSLGLLVIGRFTGRGQHSLLSRIAEKSFAGQIKRHMRPDGSMIEDSVSYHRFVIEMLAVKYILGDHSPITTDALRGAAEHLRRLGVFDGPIPHWGDWDEGRVLASSGDELDLAGSTALGLVLTEAGPDPRWRSEFDEVAWYAGPPATGRDRVGDTPHLAPVSLAVTTSGGITRASVGAWSVWLKVGTGPSHQHADLTHVSARFEDAWVLVDPGTGTYNGKLEIRNAFRTSRSHNGLRTRGEEMLVPHRAFRWLTSAVAQPGNPATTKDAVILWGVHDAYARLPGGGQIARAVVVTGDGLTVVDWRQDGQDALLTVALPPGTHVSEDSMELDRSKKFRLRGLEGAAVMQGIERPFAGWHSDSYGRWAAAPWLEQSVHGSAATFWGITSPFGTPSEIHVDGREITVAGVKLSMDFHPGGARMAVTADGRTRIHTTEVARE